MENKDEKQVNQVLKKLNKFDENIKKIEEKIETEKKELEKIIDERNKFFIESVLSKNLNLSEIFKTLSDLGV